MQEVHIDAPLSTFSVGVIEESPRVFGGFFPVTPTEHLSDKYQIIDRNPFLRGDSQPRIVGQESTGHVMTLSLDNFNCTRYDEHTDVDWDKIRNADNPRMLEEAATRLAVENLLMTQEVLFATRFFVPSVWGTTIVGGAGFTKWSDAASSNPIADVEAGRRAIRLGGGKLPNKLLLGWDAWVALKTHPTIMERIVAGGTPGSPAIITKQAVAAVFELDEIIVAEAVKATNPVGAAETYDFVFGKHALLAYVGANGEGDFMASAGRIFAWKGTNEGAVDEMGRTVAVTQFDIVERRITRYEPGMALDFKITGTKLGYFLQDAAA